MPGNIHHICLAEHNGEDRGAAGPTITLVEKQWAYCARGGYHDHEWKKLGDDGLPLAQITVQALAAKQRRP